jgi:PAS domain-containing protein
MPRRMEIERDVSRGLLEALLRDGGIGVAFLDVEGRYERVNDRLADMHDLSASEHLGRTVEEVIPDIAPAVRASLARAVERG